MTGFWAQARTIAARDLRLERRAGEVLWITVPFGAISLLLIPLAIGADTPQLRDIGPGLYWVVVLLFGALISVRRTGNATQAQRDLTALLGVDAAAAFAGRVAAGTTMLLVFQAIVGVAAVLLYDIDLTGWQWLFLIMPLAAAGLGGLSALAGAVAASMNTSPALVPLLVAPLAVPLLLGATQGMDSVQTGGGILPWILLMVVVDLVLAITGVLTARPLQETQ